MKITTQFPSLGLYPNILGLPVNLQSPWLYSAMDAKCPFQDLCNSLDFVLSV
ncbi:hypothetical protein [Nostoc sp.]|uniref:hypothetical protein n=1 Tax=Nostoc sp. TaxID=1180 RepID=UPI002FF552AB